MQQITLNITDNKFSAFIEFIKTLDYVEIQKYNEVSKVLGELQNSLKQVKQMREGKIPKQTAKEFLNEL